MIVCQLSTLMGTRRMTQSRLAALTGLHRDTIRKLYHNGWTSIRRDTLDRLCTVLEVQVSELLIWLPEERP
jgi:putative transcriptional regulator